MDSGISATMAVAAPFVRAHGGSTMGDKSPKSIRKRADQKQDRVDEGNRKKQVAIAAKQVVAKKK